MPIFIIGPRRSWIDSPHTWKVPPDEVAANPAVTKHVFRGDDPREYDLGRGRLITSLGGHAFPADTSQTMPTPAVIRVGENQPPFQGKVTIGDRGGVDTVGTTPPAVPVQIVSREQPRPYPGDSFALRGPPDADAPPNLPGPTILRPGPPMSMFDGQRITAIGKVPTVDTTVPPPPVGFFRVESPPPFPGFVVKAIGQPGTVDTVRTVLAPIIAQIESPPPWPGSVVFGRGGPDPVTTVPVVTHVVTAWAENAQPWPGSTISGHGGPAAVTTDPVPPQAVFGRREEERPDPGYAYATHAISVWWDKPPAPLLARVEEPRPAEGRILRGYAYESVTPQDPTPRAQVFQVEDPRPWPGFVLITGQQRWQYITPIISTTPAELQTFEARSKAGRIAYRAKEGIVEMRSKSGRVSKTSR